MNYAGYGIPYGGIPGINIEFNPIQYIGLSCGLGYNKPVGLGGSIGAILYLVNQNHKIRPHLSYYRGVVATIVNWPDYKHGIGNAYGVGIELRFIPTSTVEFGVHHIDLNMPDGYKESMPGWRVFSLGVGRCF